MLINSFAGPAFGAGFWEPYARGSGPCDTAQASVEAGTSRLSYSAQLHGNHADFCQGPDFPQYQEEVQANLSFLADYCQQHGLADAPSIADNLRTFFRHRFEEHHYFGTRTEIIDSIGKRSLDEFCWMIRHEAIGEDVKTATIRDLAMGMTQCADGAVSDLVGAARNLARTAGGLRGTLWAVKEDIARGVLQQVAQEWFARRAAYAGNEIHYVNTAWNILADRYGLRQYPDGISMPEAEGRHFLFACEVRLKTVLTPDRLALTIAQACQARFNSQIPMAIEQAAGIWTAGIQEQCTEKMQEIGSHFGLTSDDELRFDPEAQAWIPRESDLRLRSFLKLQEDDGAPTYMLRTDPSLIALDLLRGMAGLNLLQDTERPRIHGQWTDPDGMLRAVFSHGVLAWTAQASSSAAFRRPLWASKEIEIESVTVQDLLQWQAGRPDDMSPLPESIMAHIIGVVDTAQLAKMPVRWLRTTTLEQRLRRLNKAEGMGYLEQNSAELATGFPDSERYQMLGRILHLGMGRAIPGVVFEPIGMYR